MNVRNGVVLMNAEQFEAALGRERLGRWIQRGRPTGVSADKVCIFQDGDHWVTVMTDERASVIATTFREFDSESAALDDALDGARMLRSFTV